MDTRLPTYRELTLSSCEDRAPVRADMAGRAAELFQLHANAVHMVAVMEHADESWSGIVSYPNGTTVEGRFTSLGAINSVADAQVVAADNIAFAGTVKSGMFDGQGTIVAGSYAYTGQFDRGVPHGNGELTLGPPDASADMISYAGDWRLGVASGEGVMKRPGYEYRGQFRAGKRHGQGIVRRQSGCMRSFKVTHTDDVEVSCIDEQESRAQHLASLIANTPGTCKVCLAGSATVVFQPCRHLCTCVECLGELQTRNASPKCPVCRAPIQNTVCAILS